jgi:hypothetical protein
MYAETVHQIWFQGGRGKPLRPEAIGNGNRVRYCTPGKASSGLEGQEVTTDCETASTPKCAGRGTLVESQKIQDRKVVFNSHNPNLVGHSAKFDSIERNWNVKIAREVVHGSGKFSKNMILHANLSIICPKESD